MNDNIKASPIHPNLSELQQLTAESLNRVLDMSLDAIFRLMLKRSELGYRYLKLDTSLRVRPDIVNEFRSWGLMVNEYEFNTEILWGAPGLSDDSVAQSTKDFIDSWPRIYQEIFTENKTEVKKY